MVKEMKNGKYILMVIYFMKENICMVKEMEKEKNIMKRANWYLKEIIYMVKGMEKEKYIIIVVNYHLKVNIYMIIPNPQSPFKRKTI